MIVECENCKTQFNVDEGRIKDEGSKVRCSKCKSVFKIYKPAPKEELPAEAPPETPFEEAPEEESWPEESAPEEPSAAEDEVDFGDLEEDLGLDDDFGFDEPESEAEAEEAAESEPEPEAGEDFDFGDLEEDLGLADDFGLDDDFGTEEIEEAAAAPEPEPASSVEALDTDEDLAPDDDLGEVDDRGLSLEEELGLGGEDLDSDDDGFGLEDADDDLDLGLGGDDLDLGVGEDDLGLDEDGGLDEAGDLGALEDDMGLGDDVGADLDSALDQAVPDAGEMEEDLDLGAPDDDFGLAEEPEPAPPIEDDADDLMDGIEYEDDEGAGAGEAPIGDMLDDMPVTEEPDTDDYRFGGEDEFDEEAEAYEEEEYEDVIAGEVVSRAGGKSRIFLWFLVMVFLVLAIAAAAWNWAPSLLDPVLQPLGLGAEKTEAEVDPMGSRRIEPQGAKHFFRVNEQANQILVITGRAVNRYETPRSYIELKGVLLNQKGEVLTQRKAYAGNSLSNEELETLPMAEIRKMLSVRGGTNGSNLDIQPGKGVNFMIVFDSIPKELNEYNVESVSSKPSEKK